MVTDVLFHPDHMIPPPELIAALVEFSYHAVSQRFMKPDAVPGEVRVGFFHWAGNTGIHVEKMPPLQFLLQGIVKQPADSLSLLVLFHINRGLH